MMKKSRSLYYDEELQKVRWTTTSSDNFIYNYKYLGEATESELSMMIELLSFLYEDKNISYSEFNKLYTDFRYFCDKVKGLVDEI
jgi:hypothetical protein